MRSACFLFRRYDLCMNAGSFVLGGALLGGRSANLFHFVLGKLRNFFDNIFEFLPPTELEVIKKPIGRRITIWIRNQILAGLLPVISICLAVII